MSSRKLWFWVSVISLTGLIMVLVYAASLNPIRDIFPNIIAIAVSCWLLVFIVKEEIWLKRKE
jgi:hypothetical protein